MILYIAEKPSVGRAIAQALPGPHKRGDGFITVGRGDVVSWCVGHLLEQAEPEAYDPAFKKWSHDHLPIVPRQWLLLPRRQTARQLKVLRKLVRQADQLVHVGDPDREGQLLVDEVIDFFGVKGAKKTSTRRCLINDLNPPAVSKSLANLRSNAEFAPLSMSALARSRADWLYGINLTRAYTLQGQKAGYRGVLSVGRVQTPVLGLVVRRDLEIAGFVSVPFYEVWANLQTDTGQFKAKWIPSEDCRPYLDEARRNLSRRLAENVVGRISQQPATVAKLTRKRKTQPAPLPYSLSSLQIDANQAHGLGAQQVLDVCQRLYETHKAITYPRSDCRYLPVEQLQQADRVVRAVQAVHEFDLGELDLKRKSKAFDDAKVGAHHAIIPSGTTIGRLSPAEMQVYRLISRNYVAQFLPAFEYFDTQVEVAIQGGLFKAGATQIGRKGWTVLFPKRPSHALPALQEGQTVQSLQADLLEKHTTPPKHFTEATLLAAMTGISRYVKNLKLKAILKDTDGLGTEATRAGIIELLLKRDFLRREGKSLRATEVGTGLIAALPESLTLPDLTARWEAILIDISERRAAYDTLMTPLQEQVREQVRHSRGVVPAGMRDSV